MDRLDVWVMGFASPDDAVAGVMDAFGVDQEQATKLVTSAPLVVKRDVEPELALRYRRTLEALGAEVQVRPAGSTPPGEASPGPRAPSVRPASPSAPPPSQMQEADADGAPSAGVDRLAPEPAPAALPAPEPTVEPPPAHGLPVRLRVIAGGLAVAAVVVIAVIASSDGSDPPATGVDGMVERAMAEHAHPEARRWIENPRHMLFGVPEPAAALGLCNQLYAAGASSVEVMGIEGDAFTQYGDTLVVTLPVDAVQRQAVIALAEEARDGADGETALAPSARIASGERYLRIILAPDRGSAPRAKIRDFFDEADRVYKRDKRGFE
jgi:hypothetical protein